MYLRSLHSISDYCLHSVTGMYDYYTVSAITACMYDYYAVCAITASIWWQVRTIITLSVRLLPPFGDRYVRLLHCMCDYCVHSVTGMHDYYTVSAITACFRKVSTIITLHVRLLPPFGDRHVLMLHCTCDYRLHLVTAVYDYYTLPAITASIRWQASTIITLYVRLLPPFGDRYGRLLHCMCDYCPLSVTGTYDYYTVCAITASTWWQPGMYDHYTVREITASIRWQACTIITLYVRLLPPLDDR